MKQFAAPLSTETANNAVYPEGTVNGTSTYVDVFAAIVIDCPKFPTVT